jgi:hypothetical protein
MRRRQIITSKVLTPEAAVPRFVPAVMAQGGDTAIQ